MKEFSRLSPLDIAHLRKVYFTLFVWIAASACGAYAHPGGLTVVMFFFHLIWIISSLQKEDKTSFSQGTMFVAVTITSFCAGASICPLLGLVCDIDWGFVVTYLAQTAAPFGCFTVAALLKEHTDVFYFNWMVCGSILLEYLCESICSDLFDRSSYWIYTYMKICIVLPLQFWWIVVFSGTIITRPSTARVHFVNQSLAWFTDIAPHLKYLLQLLRGVNLWKLICDLCSLIWAALVFLWHFIWMGVGLIGHFIWRTCI